MFECMIANDRRANNMIINYSDQEVIEGKSLFFRGPTSRGENVISWRTEACQVDYYDGE